MESIERESKSKSKTKTKESPIVEDKPILEIDVANQEEEQEVKPKKVIKPKLVVEEEQEVVEQEQEVVKLTQTISTATIQLQDSPIIRRACAITSLLPKPISNMQQTKLMLCKAKAYLSLH